MAFFICSNCGYGSGSWIGKCPDCGQWNTLVAQRDVKDKGSRKSEPMQQFVVTPLSKIRTTNTDRRKTGLFEFDRVIGGGLFPGEVILLTGEPGVGKSTLLLQALAKLRTLYISGEEAPEQVRDRADRLKIHIDEFLFSDNLQVEGIADGIEQLKDKIDVVVVDSVQTVYSNKVDSQPGSVTQLRESAAQLIIAAKKMKIPMILVGHITKEGDIAGPKTLEHMVDAVLTFEGERVSQYRVLRGQKNRFGSTDEVGIFEMAGEGLKEVDNPMIFLEEHDVSVPGKAIVGITEGRRPLFFEIQTLASPTVLAMPRRVVKGVDYNKVLLLLAVIRKQLNIQLDKYDIYVNVIGGVDVKSTAADLGIVASLISSIKNTPLPKNSMFIGEVGLLGEVRKGASQDKVINEASRLTFKKIYSSANTKNIKDLAVLVNRG
ncbi:MAG: DNA repair protein RadA [Patescibacteria group bacterium]